MSVNTATAAKEIRRLTHLVHIGQSINSYRHGSLCSGGRSGHNQLGVAHHSGSRERNESCGEIYEGHIYAEHYGVGAKGGQPSRQSESGHI